MGEPTRGSKHAGLLPGACLALLLSGIWTGDAALLSLANPPGGILSIRLASLAAYLAAFGAVVLLEKRHAPAEAAPGRSAAQIAWLAKPGAALCATGLFALLSAPWLAGSALVFASLALAKLVGPVLSIPLLTLFATLPRATAARAAALAMAGASLCATAARSAMEATSWGAALPLAASFACLAGCAVLMSTTLLRQRGKDAPSAHGTASVHGAVSAHGAASAPHPERQPTKSPLAGKIVFGFVGTALMLGFLRAGEPSSALPETAAALAVMAAAALATWKLPSLDTREILRAGIACTTAGLLLAPLLSALSPEAGSLLAEAGTMLLEIALWTSSALVVAMSENRLRTAAAARLAVVAGHLLGALAATTATLATAGFPQAHDAASLAIAFAYIAMLLYLSDGSFLPLPHRIRSREGAPADAGRTAAETGPSAAKGPGDAPSAEEFQDDWCLWGRPCKAVADEHGLTPRETDVLEQLAQGRDLAFMEETFVLSRNTVKMHIRHVYAKLGVHSKQEVIDLVEARRRQR